MKTDMKTKFYKWLHEPNKSSVRQWIEALIVILPIAFLIRTFGYGLYVVPSGSMETTMLVGERFVADKFTVWFTDVKRGDIISFNDATYPYSRNKFKKFIEYYFWGPPNVTKRVIGIPGDHVKGMIEDGKPVIYLNGTKLDEPYLNKYPIIAVCKYDLDVLRRMTARDLERYSRRGSDLCSFKSFDPDKSFEDQSFYKIRPSRILIDPMTTEPRILRPQTPIEDDCDKFDIHLGSDEYWVMGDNRLGSCDSRSWGPLKKELIHGKIVFRIMSIDSTDSWLIFDLIKNPIDFFKRIRWNRWLQRVR